VRESSVMLVGTLRADARSKGGAELQVDYWEPVHIAASEVMNRINPVRAHEAGEGGGRG
jgi:hypothetical protein